MVCVKTCHLDDKTYVLGKPLKRLHFSKGESDLTKVKNQGVNMGAQNLKEHAKSVLY